MELPLMAEWDSTEGDSPVPVFPGSLYDPAGGTLAKRGGVVPHELRILFESCSPWAYKIARNGRFDWTLP